MDTAIPFGRQPLARLAYHYNLWVPMYKTYIQYISDCARKFSTRTIIRHFMVAYWDH